MASWLGVLGLGVMLVFILAGVAIAGKLTPALDGQPDQAYLTILERSEMKRHAAFAIVALQGALVSCGEHLNRALEEEKSYTRHAMETYRKDPKVFQGDPYVLESWSRADDIAKAVAEKGAAAPWAATADNIAFLPSGLRRNPDGVPFCVIRLADKVVVLDIQSRTEAACSAKIIQSVDVDSITSGDLEFSGRSDFWIYVLKLPFN